MRADLWIRSISCAALAASLSLIACSDGEEKKAGGGGDGGGAEEPTIPCNEIPLDQSFDRGRWSREYTVAGVGGPAGPAPRVNDLTANPAGGIFAAGSFGWLHGNPVTPLIQRSLRSAWSPLDLGAGREELPSSFTAIAARGDGLLAVATKEEGPPFGGEILLRRGSGGLEPIANFTGLVRSLAWHDDQLWVAGSFTLEESGTSDLAIWDASPSNPKWWAPPGGAVNGPVYTLLLDDRSIVVGGSFTELGGEAISGIAGWDGGEWTAYDLTLPGSVYALARVGDSLYAGGAIPDAESGVGGILRWSGGGWERVGGGVSFQGRPGVVGSLVSHAGALYLSGCFDRLGQGAASLATLSIASWAGGSWQTLATPARLFGSVWSESNPVECGDEGPDSVWNMEQQRLFSDGDRLFAAGSFGGIGATASQGIISFDGTTWFPEASARFSGPGDQGNGLSGVPDDLATGGPGCVAYALGDPVAARTLTAPSGILYGSGLWTPFGTPRPEGLSCKQLEVDAEEVVYVGCNVAGGGGARIFTVDEEGWHPLDEAHELDPLEDMRLDHDGVLWLAGGGAQGYLARFDGEAFHMIEDRFDGKVRRLSLEQASAGPAQRLVVAGDFTKIGDIAVDGLAHWDGAAWSALGAGLGAPIAAVEYGAKGIYASTTPDGPATRIILGKWEGSAWTELGTEANGLPPPVEGGAHGFTALLERSGVLLATGKVPAATGGQNVFVWDGRKLRPISGGAVAGSVDSIAISAKGIFFGGTITEIGPEIAHYPSVGVARFHWETLGPRG